MKDLGKWQLISFISRGLAMAIGLIQSFIVIRILSVGEWGIIQLASSIGGALGVYQHLGLASASTREIASTKDDSDVFKIFLTSVAIRYFITVPLALGLFFYSDHIAENWYHNSVLILPLKIYAVTYLVQGVQSIFNSVISGTKRFKRLFIYQVVVSVINIAIFIPLILLYRVNGYFWAYFIFNIVNSVILAFLAFGPLKSTIKLPNKSDFMRLLKEIFSVSIAIYFVKILATNWEKLGSNLLGLSNQPELIAIFAFALLYAKKIMSISDAVTDVNLPLLSESYKNDIQEFKSAFSNNFDKVFSFIIISSTIACYWAPEIISLLVGGEKYEASYVFIPPILFAFVIYSIADIVKSSVYVPAKLTRQMVVSYLILVVSTLLFFYSTYTFMDDLSAMAFALAFGSLLGIIYVFISIKKALNYVFFGLDHWIVLGQATLIGWTGMLMSLTFKSLVFPVYIGMLIWALVVASILSKSDIAKLGTLWKRKS